MWAGLGGGGGGGGGGGDQRVVWPVPWISGGFNVGRSGGRLVSHARLSHTSGTLGHTKLFISFCYLPCKSGRAGGRISGL